MDESSSHPDQKISPEPPNGYPMENRMQVDSTTLILTRGQWLVDAIVWADIKQPKKGQRTWKCTVSSLRSYMGKMGGHTELIDTMQQAQARSMANPRQFRHLRALAQARTALEAHIEALEVANDMRLPMVGSTRCESRRERDRKTRKPKICRGWSVCESGKGRAGRVRYRLTLTSRRDGKPRQVGTFGSKLEAQQEGIRLIAELRGTAPLNGAE